MKKKLLIGGLLLLSIASAWAHGDEDHGAAQTAEIVTADKPNRLPDGRVFIPKAVQRRLEIRTLLAEEKTVARTLELNGHVVMDPDSGGRVQAMQSGRIESAARGLPHVGAKVRKGDVLAYVQPAISSLERASAQAEQREVQARLQLAEKQLVRLKSLSGTVPGKEIDAAEAEIAALQGRYQALATGNAREALRAPVSGVIAANNVVNGQVVELDPNLRLSKDGSVVGSTLVLRGIRNLELGVGLVAGFGIVLLAIVLDRVTKSALARIDASKARH